MKPEECSKILPALADYAVGGLDEPHAQSVCDHLADCACCRRELEALEQMAAMLLPIEQVEPPQELWARIDRQLVDRQLEPCRLPYAFCKNRVRPLLAVAAMAVVLLAVVILSPTGDETGPSPADLPVLMGAEGADYAETQIAAAWDQPLADEVALALAMAAIEPVVLDEVSQ